MWNYNSREEVLRDLEKISQQVDDELQVEDRKVDGNKVTKLLFQQLMVGLNMQQFPQQ